MRMRQPGLALFTSHLGGTVPGNGRMTALSLLSRPPLWRESRVGLELATLLRDPVFRGDGVKDGRGQPVLLIPGFLAGDDSLALMTRWLRSTNHYAKRAGIRMNVDCSEAAVQRLEEKVEVLVERQGQRAAIVGQSRGGHFARVLAKRRPDLVGGIVTLGSPLTDPLAIHPLVRAQVYAVGALGTVGVRGLFRHSCLWGDCCTGFWEDAEAPLPKGVRFLSVYSRSDGVVRWRSCLDPCAEHFEIRASHIGMGMHPRAWRVVASELEQLRKSETRRQAAVKASRRRKAATRRARIRRAA